MSDEGFHEIQLNSKQLIFLCMTAALVLVVAFLSGVLVGRGVRSEKDASPVADAVTAAVTPADALAASPAPAGAATALPAGMAPPAPVEEDLTYDKRLAGKQAPVETLQPAPAPPAPQSAAAGKDAAAKNSAPKDAPKQPAKPAAAKEVAPAKDAPAGKTAAKAEPSLFREPAGSGYYLKIAAYKDRAQAEGLAKRLSGKGYSTFVVSAPGNLFSVRVGKYKTRKEADSIRRRLEKEEQLNPLISH